MSMNGAQITVRSLEEAGVNTLFGLPGGTVIPLYDALYDSSIQHILVRHEQAAAHAADGFSRAGNKTGVCLATSGPGATNLVTGIATAFQDSSPMVAITGQVGTRAIGTDAFQEAHILGITLPVVKHSMQVRHPDEIPHAIAGAFHIASTGRPGPVLVDIPVDIQKAQGQFTWPTHLNFPGYNPEMEEDLSSLDKAISLIRSAARPVILAGNGVIVANAAPELMALATELEIPVATSLLGKGAFPESHTFSLGMVGMHGRPVANRAMGLADLIIVIGARFSDRSTGRKDRFASQARVIHLDLDPAEIDKSVGADVWLLGNASKLMDTLRLAVRGTQCANHREWLAELAMMNDREPLQRDVSHTEIKPWHIMSALYDATGGEAVVTTEVGQHQMWAALYYKSDHARRFLTSGGLGTMGFGFPSAMGAHFARPDLPVFCIAGDGSFMMNIQELDTCARYQIPVKILLLDNGCLGMVRQWQEMFFDQRYSNTLYSRQPDFVKMAESMGVSAFSVRSPKEVRKAMERALATPGPVLVHLPIPQSEKVLPITPAGAPLDEMILA
ncbi:MAG: biosynthetic-type acetolactate synthase large subunit [Synergistaceae bacterium]|nr:biosynthetic-type acetolactate synthase large subunit [Synergistaceae bacterium]